MENILEIVTNGILTSKDLEKELSSMTVNQETQKGFLETTLGKAINTGLDIGIRILLPDLIENQVIGIKNAIFKEGLLGGCNKAIDSAIDLGKSALGIFTGNFENVSQLQTAVDKGGIIDSISGLLDTGLNQAIKNDLITQDVASVIKKGKNVILRNVSTNIENTLTEQVRGVEKVDKYITNWNAYYQKQDFEGMSKEYLKLKEQLKTLLPLEQTIQKARQLENLHNRIKNNGQNFNLTDEELELANKLI